MISRLGPRRLAAGLSVVRSLPGRRGRRLLSRLRGNRLREQSFWLTNTSGYRIAAHLHEPSDVLPRPAVVLVPARGIGGEVFCSRPYLLNAQELAAQGIRCLHFDPVGRGASWGHDDFAGLEGQDSLRTVLDFIHSLRRVKGDRVGVISFSSGLCLAAPCLAREGRRLGTRFLIDWEGPASRHELLRGGPLPSTARSAMARDPDAFWALREPITWIDKVPCHYLRIQGPSQQSQGAGDEQAALQLVSAATQGQAASTRLWGNPRDTSWRIEQHSDLRWAPHDAGPLNRVLIQSTLEMSGIDPSGADSPS